MKMQLLLPFTSLFMAALCTPASSALLGKWTFQEGSGTVVGDSSGNARNGTVVNPDGGLGPLNSVWAEDFVRGKVISFNGTDTGALVTLGQVIPLLTLTSNLTIMFWAKGNQTPTDATQTNSVIIGNRYAAGGVDFIPREFMKCTATKFEYHREGAGENLEYQDFTFGEWHHIAIVKSGATLTSYRDGLFSATSQITVAQLNPQPLNFGADPGGGVNERFNGYLDDVLIYDEARTISQIISEAGINVPPVAAGSPIVLNAILTGQPLSKSLAPFVVDADGNTLTYVKDFGPSWLSVSSAGVVSGTPAAVDVGISDIEVSVSDGFTSILVIVRVAVYDGTIPAANLLGRWKLNEGSGAIGAESGGGGLSANLLKVATGGLGTAGNAWAKDPVLGNVFTAAGGVDGASATVGDGPGTQLIPAFFQSDNFSWTFYARTEQGAGTQIILGNRFGTDGLDTVPREFVKFTNNGFEWHFNGAGENIDYPVLPMSQWHHHAVVKLQDSISYYRDGKLLGARKITGAPFGSMPLYFAGQNGLETWRGALSDVRIYNGALQPAQVAAMITDQTASALGLNILSLNVLPTTLSVLWRSDPGVNYRVEQSTTMASGSWTPAVASVASQGFATQTSVARPAGAGRLFLRVVQLPLVP